MPNTNMVLRGNIVLDDRIVKNGFLQITGEQITAVAEDSLPGVISDYSEFLLVPGFVDIHVHGYADGEAKTLSGIQKMAAFAPSCGTTSFCPTLSPVPWEEIITYLENCATVIAAPKRQAAKVAGAHLEGPYIVPDCRGGMPEGRLRLPTPAELTTLLSHAHGHLRMMTLSPEIPGAEWLIPLLVENHCIVSAGHTNCPITDFRTKFVPSGISHVCHLFDTFKQGEVENGVTQTRLVDEVLVNDHVTFEIIPDGIHVPPTLVKLAKRAGGSKRFVGITDAMQGAGLPDGEYSLADGRKYLVKKDDVCRMPGTDIIVGSGLTMNIAFAYLINRFDFTPSEATQALSANPARVIGLDRVGRLAPGYAADITVLEPDTGHVHACWINGKKVYEG